VFGQNDGGRGQEKRERMKLAILKLRILLWWCSLLDCFTGDTYTRNRLSIQKIRKSSQSRAYWGYVNQIRCFNGDWVRKLLGPVQQFTLEEARSTAALQAHEVLYGYQQEPAPPPTPEPEHIKGYVLMENNHARIRCKCGWMGTLVRDHIETDYGSCQQCGAAEEEYGTHMKDA